SPLNANCFNQGYYDKFFVEIKKLGRGLRGSVFLVQHVLDAVYLGDYAVKSIPIGTSHTWLVRQLQEVHLLERLMHPNIIHYKHAWYVIENKQLSVFGPEVPCLFILMELANGGSLEDYIYLQQQQDPIPDDHNRDPSLSAEESKEQRIHRLKLLRKKHAASISSSANLKSKANSDANLQAKTFGGIGTSDDSGKRVRYLTKQQIWSLFLDICEGLAHLHRNGIIHRDLKPPNLLLRFKDASNRDEIPRVLISDFGECEIIGEKVQRAETANRRTGATGTLEFMCPELLEQDEQGRYRHDHSVKGDMFSLGVVLYFLCYSSVPYSQVDDVDLLKEEILKFDGVSFPVGGHERRVPVELQRLIQRLLSRDPNQRPTIEDIVSYYRSSPPEFGDEFHAASNTVSSSPGSGGVSVKQRRGLSFTENE
ncbi:kinase-like domain-containing protein, partial [Obelidium mucronatum]